MGQRLKRKAKEVRQNIDADSCFKLFNKLRQEEKLRTSNHVTALYGV
jgi:hypothetical protein